MLRSEIPYFYFNIIQVRSWPLELDFTMLKRIKGHRTRSRVDDYLKGYKRDDRGLFTADEARPFRGQDNASDSTPSTDRSPPERSSSTESPSSRPVDLRDQIDEAATLEAHTDKVISDLRLNKAIRTLDEMVDLYGLFDDTTSRE